MQTARSSPVLPAPDGIAGLGKRAAGLEPPVEGGGGELGVDVHGGVGGSESTQIFPAVFSLSHLISSEVHFNHPDLVRSNVFWLLERNIEVNTMVTNTIYTTTAIYTLWYH